MDVQFECFGVSLIGRVCISIHAFLKTMIARIVSDVSEYVFVPECAPLGCCLPADGCVSDTTRSGNRQHACNLSYFFPKRSWLLRR